MRIAYLIDRDSLGGGMEYVRWQIAAHPNDECRVFFSDRGECSPHCNGLIIDKPTAL